MPLVQGPYFERQEILKHSNSSLFGDQASLESEQEEGKKLTIALWLSLVPAVGWELSALA